MAAARILVVELPVMLGPEAQASWVVVEPRGLEPEPVERGTVNLGALGSLSRFKAARWVGVLPASISTVMSCDLPASLLKQNKLQAALEGALEDKLLGDANATALSCAPDGMYTPGRITQAAATKREWLDKLKVQSKAQQVVWHSLVPEAALLQPGQAYAKPDGTVLLCGPDGDTASLPAQAPLIGQDSDWTPLDMEPAHWLAQAATSRWTLLQGDYGPQARSAKFSQGFAALWQRGLLKPVVWGLIALLAATVLGMNARAWQLRQQVAERKEQQKALLKRAAPKIDPGMVDAAQWSLLLRRELNTLRASTGQPNANEVEAMIAAVNGASAGNALWQRIEGKAGELTVSLSSAPEPAVIEAIKLRGYQATADASSVKVKVAN
jgi:general secretion pathway protein L